MSIFCCPICGGPLERGPSAYSCPAGHSFDLAREGYVHLLPANRMHSKMPGDDKGMAAARWAFLSKDYYAPLRDALCSIALANTGPAPSVLDTGCGEGYYTSGVYQALRRAGRSVTLADGHLQGHPPPGRQAGKGRGICRGLVVPSAGGGRLRGPAAQLLFSPGH